MLFKEIDLDTSTDIYLNAFTLVGGQQVFHEECGATGLSSSDQFSEKNMKVLNVSTYTSNS